MYLTYIEKEMYSDQSGNETFSVSKPSFHPHAAPSHTWKDTEAFILPFLFEPLNKSYYL